MFYISGIIIAALSVIYSVVHLRQSVSNYFDPVGLAVVIGGTIAVAVMVLPWEMLGEIKGAFKTLFTAKKVELKAVNLECLELVRQLTSGSHQFKSNQSGIIGQTLNDGVELVSLGFTHSRIQEILEERIFQWLERKQKIANALRSLAKYPPAFGLVGTVLGLVSLMRAISDGASSTEAGFRMAVALVATLYGLLLANLVLNPAGENVLKSISFEKKGAELALQAVSLSCQNANLLEAQEVLNSYVELNDRVSILGTASTESQDEAVA
jgi:chemotaxis protein MotA